MPATRSYLIATAMVLLGGCLAYGVMVDKAVVHDAQVAQHTAMVAKFASD
ncbi:MAG: hypothetical protein Q7U16_13675 [Agitococcus sp.]|nr:hypothetical protein [Agitococcus sp.]